jgi:hypothetical protein
MDLQKSFVIFLANGEDLARQNETDPPIRTDPDSGRTLLIRPRKIDSDPVVTVKEVKQEFNGIASH